MCLDPSQAYLKKCSTEALIRLCSGAAGSSSWCPSHPILMLWLCTLVGQEEAEFLVCRCRVRTILYSVRFDSGHCDSVLSTARSTLKCCRVSRTCRASAPGSGVQFPTIGLGCLFPTASKRCQTPAPLAPTRNQEGQVWEVHARQGIIVGTEHHSASTGLIRQSLCRRLQKVFREEYHCHHCSPVWPRDP